MTKKDLNFFYKQCLSAADCSRANKLRFKNMLVSAVQDVLEETHDISMENLIAILGSPQSISESFLETIPVPNIRKWKLKRKIVIITTVILLTFSLVFSAIYYTHHLYNAPVIEVSTTIIDNEIN